MSIWLEGGRNTCLQRPKNIWKCRLTLPAAQYHVYPQSLVHQEKCRKASYSDSASYRRSTDEDDIYSVIHEIVIITFIPISYATLNNPTIIEIIFIVLRIVSSKMLLILSKHKKYPNLRQM